MLAAGSRAGPRARALACSIRPELAGAGLAIGSRPGRDHSPSRRCAEGARKHRSIEFESSEVVSEGKGYRIKGELTLHGVTCPISAKVNPSRGRWSTQVSINQPDYGIEPFRATLGTLKARPPLGARRRASAARLLTATSHGLVDGLNSGVAADARRSSRGGAVRCGGSSTRRLSGLTGNRLSVLGTHPLSPGQGRCDPWRSATRPRATRSDGEGRPRDEARPR
jgi:hypothetical protein